MELRPAQACIKCAACVSTRPHESVFNNGPGLSRALSPSPWFNIPINSKNVTKKYHITKMHHAVDFSECLPLKIYFLLIFRKMCKAVRTPEQKVQCPALSGLIWSPEMISFIMCVLDLFRNWGVGIGFLLNGTWVLNPSRVFTVSLCLLPWASKQVKKKKNPVIEQQHSCYIYTHTLLLKLPPTDIEPSKVNMSKQTNL